MEARLDALQRELQRALRAVLAGAADGGDEHWWAELARLEAFALALPPAAGGLDLGQSAAVLLCEELGRELVEGLALDTLTAADAIELAGPDGQHWPRLAELAAGRWRASVALDLAGRAEPAGAGLLLRGEAPFVTDPGRADALLLAVPGGDRRRLFLVPADRPGWTARPRATIAPAGLCSLALDGLRLDPCDALVGDADASAGQVDASGLPEPALVGSRARRAAWLVGLAAGAHRHSVLRARERVQFDRPLIEHQVVAFRLAELAARLDAARLCAHRAAWLVDAGRPARLAATEALAMAAELALAATREGMQLHGAYGMTEGAVIQRYYRHAALAANRQGRPRALWREAGRLRLAAAQAAEHEERVR
jgi:alkylation response protein AidB-like acyl-CoA dehydrogenase